MAVAITERATYSRILYIKVFESVKRFVYNDTLVIQLLEFFCQLTEVGMYLFIIGGI